jgi:hypothetical protein
VANEGCTQFGVSSGTQAAREDRLERVSYVSQPGDGGCEADEGELVVAGGRAAPLFEVHEGSFAVISKPRQL